MKKIPIIFILSIIFSLTQEIQFKSANPFSLRDIITNLDDKRFSHLNFSMMNFSKDLIDNMYQKDHASHLKNDYHAKIFLN